MGKKEGAVYKCKHNIIEINVKSENQFENEKLNHSVGEKQTEFSAEVRT